MAKDLAALHLTQHTVDLVVAGKREAPPFLLALQIAAKASVENLDRTRQHLQVKELKMEAETEGHVVYCTRKSATCIERLNDLGLLVGTKADLSTDHDWSARFAANDCAAGWNSVGGRERIVCRT